VVPPLPESNTDWQELEKQLFMRTFARLPVTLVRGQGALVWDINEKEYLDFVGGWAVNSLGHCHPVVVNALTEQAKTLLQVSNQFYTIPQLQLAELLINNSCLDRIFYCNSGAEANEGAIKLVRKYGKLHLNGAYQIITTHDSFHGRTLATVAATGQIKYQEPYIPLPNGFINVDYNDVAAIKQATSDSTCAIMIEPIQGEGGVNIPNAGYMQEIRAWCDEKGLVLILDEVQTGIGRIGTLFGYEQFGIEPDIMTLAKGLGSGVPIGAILAKERVSVFSPGDHGSTFGGNPLVCAVGYAALKYIIENNIPGKVAELGDYFTGRLMELKSKFKTISGVRGRGLLLALAFTNDIAPDIVKASLEKGLLINQVKPNAVRFMPPLIIMKKDIDKAINILEEILGSR
jgi:acetylornithine/N-succinyldiaminopimelate aminotransferase